MAEKEGGIVKKGQEDGMKLAVSLLQKFELPQGLLPLANVIEVDSWSALDHCYVEMKKIKKLKGVKAKELMLWPPVSEIIADPAVGKIHFKSLAGITKTFPVEAFAAGQ
ncbi:hypothetical protein MLD38_009190 [Melastoma candidum]|uniref:Uncharacterized protein n=1 Tax=Melastoma candidum TaxID=119954 RepID=A0ACB9RW69_9MYRT|nr:hypothetical protein MLD38_009190 [Melastoma candidum]